MAEAELRLDLTGRIQMARSGKLLLKLAFLFLLVALLVLLLLPVSHRRRALQCQEQIVDLARACETYAEQTGGYPASLFDVKQTQPICPAAGEPTYDYRRPPPQATVTCPEAHADPDCLQACREWSALARRVAQRTGAYPSQLDGQPECPLGGGVLLYRLRDDSFILFCSGHHHPQVFPPDFPVYVSGEGLVSP